MTSSKNTKSAPTTESVFEQLQGDATPEKDAALASLEEKLREAVTARYEERFIWILVCVILVDVLWFRNAPNAVVPIIALLLEAVVLFILAKRMGIPEIMVLFERIIQSIGRPGGG